MEAQIVKWMENLAEKGFFVSEAHFQQELCKEISKNKSYIVFPEYPIKINDNNKYIDIAVFDKTGSEKIAWIELKYVAEKKQEKEYVYNFGNKKVSINDLVLKKNPSNRRLKGVFDDIRNFELSNDFDKKYLIFLTNQEDFRLKNENYASSLARNAINSNEIIKADKYKFSEANGGDVETKKDHKVKNYTYNFGFWYYIIDGNY